MELGQQRSRGTVGKKQTIKNPELSMALKRKTPGKESQREAGTSIYPSGSRERGNVKGEELPSPSAWQRLVLYQSSVLFRFNLTSSVSCKDSLWPGFWKGF